VPASSIIERDFSEQSFGAWAGFTWEEIAERDPAASKYFWADPVGLVPPGGESFAALMARVAAAIECMSAGRMGDVVAVAHGGVIRAAVAHALGLDAKSAMAVAVDNLSLTRLDRVAGGTLKGRGGPWRVVAVNRPPY
jgi:alpha-ribazole phosphatase